MRNLQRAANSIVHFCTFAQQLPLDLSVFVACLRAQASAGGEAFRGVVAVNMNRAWRSIPRGHMFHYVLPYAVDTGEAYAVSWLPAHSNVLLG